MKKENKKGINKKLHKKGVSRRIKLIMLLFIILAFVGIVPIKEIIENPSIIGFAVRDWTITSVFVTGLEYPNNCTVVLLEGWNLFSIPCITDNTSLDYMLSNISGNYNSIHAYETSDAEDPWKAYNPDLPSWVEQDLTTIDEKKGYWINMKDTGIINISGTLIIPHYVPLEEGWNLIGYAANSSKSITQGLISLDGSYNKVWMYNASDNKYYYFNVDGNSTFNTISPNYGYWINITRDDNLVII
jgi:hypothetical protein